MSKLENDYKNLTNDEKKELFLNSFFENYNKYFGVSKEELSGYYDESIYSGYPLEEGGAVWETEDKSIYCFIRCLKPKRILELGNWRGVSSNHILQAVEKNGFGEVVLVDIVDYLHYDKLHNKNFERVVENSLTYINQPLDFDCIIQDNCHEYLHVKTELELLTQNTTIDFYLWSHDYYKVIVPQCEVKRAWDEVETKYTEVYPMIDEYSDCGFLIAKFKK